MDKLGFRHRRKEPTPTFDNGFQAAVLRFTAEFVNSDVVKHAGSKGTAREQPLKEFLSAHLPQAFEVRKGEVADVYDMRSPELDLIVFDRFRNFPFFGGESHIVLPCEALLASVEVKSLLTLDEIKSSFRVAERLYALRPFKKKVATRSGSGKQAKKGARFFHTIFAYDSDLSSDGWLDAEYRRLTTNVALTDDGTPTIERVYVLNRGLIDLSNKQGLSEEPGKGTALMYFYMHLLNFLSRENARRKPVPYMEYAGRMNAGLRGLGPN